MTRLIITRHGQSIANAEYRFAGHSDFDLSETGHKQAELAAEYISKNFKIDCIYSSDLLRAYNTALPTAKALGLKVIPTTALREIYAGEWEGRTTADLAVEFPEDFGVWRNDYAHSRCTGGESTAEVYERAYAAVCEIASKHDGQTVMLSTHATVVRALCARALGLSADQTGEIPFTHNASINLFNFENGTLTPESFNIIEHLGDTVTGVHKSFSK
ncbi:MAG: histidine phosphatase family protein [Ruminococcaceae bacterium]|nr:histidine phosphatase family protein [Oscillospiraceae bacterium]